MGKKYIIYAFSSFFDTAHDTLFKIQTTITSDNKPFFFYILFFGFVLTTYSRYHGWNNEMPYNAFCVCTFVLYFAKKKNWNTYFNVYLEAFYIIIKQVVCNGVVIIICNKKGINVLLKCACMLFVSGHFGARWKNYKALWVSIQLIQRTTNKI